jgi:hypothetical protein
LSNAAELSAVWERQRCYAAPLTHPWRHAAGEGGGGQSASSVRGIGRYKDAGVVKYEPDIQYSRQKRNTIKKKTLKHGVKTIRQMAGEGGG